MSDAVRTAVITGGRDYEPTDNELAELLRLLVEDGTKRVITGGARGVDTRVHAFLQSRDLELWVIRAAWETHGKAAGPIRNIEMLSQPGVRRLYAFKGGKGTWHCIRAAKQRGITVHVIGEGKW